ncbi:hypothetical protein BH11PSE12_BH11PSE12_15370 [soil metagenome]
MSVSTSIHNAHSDNLAFSLMARLHVILRRQNERVTDIEYMRIDPQYCRYILDFARQLPNPDVQEICAKLEQVFFGEQGLFVRPAAAATLLSRREPLASHSKPIATAVKVESAKGSLTDVDATALAHLDQNSIVDQTYIGRLR